jgi:OOP family OmpA-OmpF porin
MIARLARAVGAEGQRGDKKMKLRSALLAATVLAVPVAARAQMMPDLSGVYVGLGAGGNFLQPQNLRSANPIVPGTNVASLRSNLGALGLGYIGYELGNGLSLQLEGNIRNNQFTSLQNSPFPSAAHGNVETYGPMLNVMFDLSPYVGQYVPFAPYVGAGAGYLWSSLNSFNTFGPPGTPTVSSKSTRAAFAYQFILGGQYAIGYTGLSLTAEYRFLGQQARSFGGLYTEAGGAVIPGKLKFGRSFNHAFVFGVRYTFGVTPPPPPAPAPVAAPAPAPARSYLVFFDWDKATLTDRARQIIAEAAENSRHVQYTQIEVNGYTDTSGTPKYNMGLSIRRAQNVAAELVRDGVPRNAISIHGFGETHLLVPTGPGVREPQNRRVEIIIR